jgi:hypothetical protein
LKYHSSSEGYWSTAEAGGESLISTLPGESATLPESQTATEGSHSSSAAATGAAPIATAAQVAANSAATPDVLIGMTNPSPAPWLGERSAKTNTAPRQSLVVPTLPIRAAVSDPRARLVE